ncbi:MAG TPA: sulfatase/phosphatase domain-containing protein [Verrucomicrobiales bacterium]|nr:sulfatase/phosphatase domain-containing protein [Verrucomicrobiales bacterium]
MKNSVLRSLLAGSLVFGSLAAFAADQPNILFLFSDDHALQAISAYSGGRLNRTPHIDRIASEGMLFTNSFCSNSICGPSRACILTGKHSHLNGFLDNDSSRFDGAQTTFPKLLQHAGYQTSLIGKWHLVSDPTGFDYWEILPGQGDYYNPDFLQMDGSRKRYEGYCSDIITGLALDWLEQKRDAGKPFLLMAQHKAPHRNWAPPERYLRLFDEGDLPEPSTLFDDYNGRSKLLAENEMTIARHMHWGHDMKFHGENRFLEHFLGGIGNGEYNRMTEAQKAAWDAAYEPKNQAFIEAMEAGTLSDADVVRWKYQRYIKDYLRCIQAMDDGIGRILDYLDQSGLSRNTIVIYSSDQGFYLGEHGWYDKRWMFEESFAMPFLIRWPGVIEPGTRSTALIQNIDYGPTLLEVAGVSVPGEMQGRSFRTVLENGGYAPEDWRDALYYAYYGERTHHVAAHDGIRTLRHKLMFFPRTNEWQLFDLQHDPREMRSVHDDPAYRQTLANLQERYRELRDENEVNSAVIPGSRLTEEWWRERWREKNEQTREGPAELLFVGDSITQSWEGPGKELWEARYAPRRAVNLGFSGDRTEHVLWRLRTGQFGGTRPKAAVVMIGTNNTGHRQQAAAETAAGIRAVVMELRTRFPEMPVLLLGVFPRGETAADPLRRLNAEINGIIATAASEDPKVEYLDIGQVFLEEDGTLSKEIMPDFLHLSGEGYRRWSEAIEEPLRRLGGFEELK